MANAGGSARSHRFSTAAHLFKIFFVMLELGLVVGSFILAFFVLFGSGFPDMPKNNFGAFVDSVPLVLLAALIFLDLFGMTHFFRKTNEDIFGTALRFSLLEGIAAMAAAFFVRGFSVPRSVILVGTLFLFVATALWGAAGLALSRWIYARGRLVVVGNSQKELEKVVEKVRRPLA